MGVNFRLQKFLSVVPILIALVVLQWVRREPKYDWIPRPKVENYPLCPQNTKEIHLLFGGTSMLGKYIVDSWKREFPDVCLMNYNRRACKNCDVSIIGDLRDTPHIERLFQNYDLKSKSRQKITTVILSVKPDLEGTNWRTFIEINFSAVVEITKLAKLHQVRDLLYVSSIAASSHYIEHKNATEKTPQPLFTEYEAPYDLSKRLAEDFILAQHEPNKFNTIALRVSGIIGGEGDPFFHHRMFPFLISFDSPIILDYGFAGNIADALVEMCKTMKKDHIVTGEFYYFTGEHIFENTTAIALSKFTGKPVLKIPHFLIKYFLDFWQWFRWDHNTYTQIDLVRCANIEQTFDQTKFHTTFKNFKPKYTIVQALELLYNK